MARTVLEPGQDTIDSSNVVSIDGGGLQLQWRFCHLDGTVKKYTTKSKHGTKGEVRRRAKMKAEELRLNHDQNGPWKSTSKMDDYIVREAIPDIENNENLRPRTKESYIRVLRLFAKEVRGKKIAQVVRPRPLEKVLVAIAKEHGTTTANQTRKTVSRYVIRNLIRDEVVSTNPLRDYTPELPQHKAIEKPEGGQALSEEDHNRVLDYLLTLDPKDIKKPARGKYTYDDMVAKRSLLIDVTLTQAATGMRIGEIRTLLRKYVDEGADPLTIEIPQSVSKTHRGRVIPVLDGRVEERFRKRLDFIDPSPDAFVFAAPVTVNKEWDASNAQKALKRFYGELADALDIPLLKNVATHVWRTTLNMEWLKDGVPAIIRAAYFGHSEDVNEQYYTDLTDIAPLIEMLRKSGL